MALTLQQAAGRIASFIINDPVLHDRYYAPVIEAMNLKDDAAFVEAIDRTALEVGEEAIRILKLAQELVAAEGK